MDPGGKIEKINSTIISTGNTQATSADKALATATKQCQRGSTRLSRDGPIFKTVATLRRNYAMNRTLQKGDRDDSATVKIKSAMTFKTIIGEPKLPNQK